jgi:hypothetical protein
VVCSLHKHIPPIETGISSIRKAIVMSTVNVKPLTQHLIQQIARSFSGRSLPQHSAEQSQTARQAAQDTLRSGTEPELEFLTSIADLPEAERTERIQRREWYAQLAARQGIAEVEWRTEQYQRTSNAIYRP